MLEIKNIKARQILDSRGNPTVETTVFLDNIKAQASVPSGASTGKHEALELRDGQKDYFMGRSVKKAVETVEKKIAPLLIGKDVSDQSTLDRIMLEADGTDNKKNFGANSILSVSVACLKASAKALDIPLFEQIAKLAGMKRSHLKDHEVMPLFNVINGGLHGTRKLTVQEFLLIPEGLSGFTKRLEAGVEIYQLLKQKLLEKNMSVATGDEGGFAPDFENNRQALDFLVKVINSSTKFKYGRDVFLGLDMASSVYFREKKYFFQKNTGFSSSDYLKEIHKLINDYKLILLEDPLAEDDWVNWRVLNQELERVKLIGDDLLVTNKKRLLRARKEKSCNGIIIKINQIGTISETLEVIKLAKDSSMTIVVSHRSGETNDDFISDLAVGASADYVKFGAPNRGERIAKYNRLNQIYQKKI